MTSHDILDMQIKETVVILMWLWFYCFSFSSRKCSHNESWELCYILKDPAMSSALEAPRFFLRTLSLSKGELFQANKILPSLKGKKNKQDFFFFFSRALLVFFSPWFTIKHFNHCELQVKLLLPAMCPGLEGVAITTQLVVCW